MKSKQDMINQYGLDPELFNVLDDNDMADLANTERQLNTQMNNLRQMPNKYQASPQVNGALQQYEQRAGNATKQWNDRNIAFRPIDEKKTALAVIKAEMGIQKMQEAQAVIAGRPTTTPTAPKPATAAAPATPSLFSRFVSFVGGLINKLLGIKPEPPKAAAVTAPAQPQRNSYNIGLEKTMNAGTTGAETKKATQAAEEARVLKQRYGYDSEKNNPLSNAEFIETHKQIRQKIKDFQLEGDLSAVQQYKQTTQDHQVVLLRQIRDLEQKNATEIDPQTRKNREAAIAGMHKQLFKDDMIERQLNMLEKGILAREAAQVVAAASSANTQTQQQTSAKEENITPAQQEFRTLCQELEKTRDDQAQAASEGGSYLGAKDDKVDYESVKDGLKAKIDVLAEDKPGKPGLQEAKDYVASQYGTKPSEPPPEPPPSMHM